MIEHDILPKWSQPIAIEKWGQNCSPPIGKSAWLAHLNYFVHPDSVVAAARLLLPKFVEHEGGVFLEQNFTHDGYSMWKEKLHDLSAVEQMLNHQHAYDLFSTTDNISEESYLGAAQLLAETTRLALGVCYPDLQFSVSVSDTEHDYGPTVSFYSLSSFSDS